MIFKEDEVIICVEKFINANAKARIKYFIIIISIFFYLMKSINLLFFEKYKINLLYTNFIRKLQK